MPRRCAIIRVAVGADIGCGINAVRTPPQIHQIPDNLKALRDAIEVKVPVGFARHKMFNAREAACKRIAPGANRLFAKRAEKVARGTVFLNTMSDKNNTKRSRADSGIG